MNTLRVSYFLIILLALAAAGCTSQHSAKAQADFDVAYTLITTMDSERMIFVGVGGEIDGQVNPDLVAQQGDKVQITLIKGDGMGIPHDFAVPFLNAQTAKVMLKGQTTELVFETSDTGEFAYYCTVSGHREMGMEGKLIVRAS